MLRRTGMVLVVLIARLGCALALAMYATHAAAGGAQLEPAARALSLEVLTRPAQDDFDVMLRRREIRVLVPYSRTDFFHTHGAQRGLTADAIRDFARWLNRRHRKALAGRPISVLPIPVTRDKLISWVAEGRGDIAAGNLTITPERERWVDFSAAGQTGVFELVVSGPRSPKISELLDLSGKEIHVRRSSSYYGSLLEINRRFSEARKPLVDIRLVPEALEDEDLMEMVSAGILGLIVVDDWKAKLWAKILPGLTVHDRIAVRIGGRVGWAFRKNSPRLAAEVNAFIEEERKNSNAAQLRFSTYAQRIKRLYDSTGGAEWGRFKDTIGIFRKYAERYGFDPLMMAAQGFQESRLKQSARSRNGAIGVMQVLPSTGRAMKVGDIQQVDANIHAGIKYMHTLIENYFKDAAFDSQNRMLFALASYNAGPGRIAELRRRAEKEGLDPNRWFGQVEQIAAQRVSRETVHYVRNVYKYYIGYALRLEAMDARKAATKTVESGVRR